MGCDIHMWVERLENDGKWHLVPDAKVYSHRNYGLFGWLADVRGWGPPIAAPRGWPEDLSPELDAYLGPDRAGRYDDEGRDKRLDYAGDHTPSWLLVSEIQEAFDRLPNTPEYETEEQRRARRYVVKGDAWEFAWGYLRYWENLAQGDGSRVRIVFNFDS